MNIVMRQATADDKAFIIDAIIEAEKSGSDIISYCAIFSITEQEFRSALSSILDENIGDQELCIQNFLIAEVDGQKAAALSTWIEMENGLPSHIIKGNLLMHFLGKDKIINAASSLRLMNEINIPREENTLQVDIGYTYEKYRGLGLFGKLLNEHIRLQQERGATFKKVQSMLLKTNTNSIKAHERIGFTFIKEKKCTDAGILKLLPADTKILMERSL